MLAFAMEEVQVQVQVQVQVSVSPGESGFLPRGQKVSTS